MQKKFLHNSYKRCIEITLVIFLVVPSITFATTLEQQYEQLRKTTPTSNKAEIDAINTAIAEKKSRMSDLQKQIDTYNSKIQQTRAQSASLQNEISLIDNKLAKTQLDVQRTQDQIDTANLEIRSLELGIKDRTTAMVVQQQSLAAYIRAIASNDDHGIIDVLLEKPTLSSFFDQVQYLSDMQRDVREQYQQLVTLKKQLEDQLSQKEQKKEDLVVFQKQLDTTKETLADTKEAKSSLVVAAKQSETSLRSTVQKLKSEQASVDSDLASIQRQLAAKTANNSKFNALPTNTTISWPVDPSRGIATYFHDPDYPFRYVFEHPGLDIRGGQGTPVRAAAAGYVARAKDAGMGYSYVMIAHSNNLSTVYGHLSRILVNEEQFVDRGQIIAYSGGMPGTPGAGNMTTGPHLHFEVRSNGIPVNPLNYLMK